VKAGGTVLQADGNQMQPDPQAQAGGPRWLAQFEDRYGTGSSGQLHALLAQPCVTFAEIAGRFGVTRERVRQWHAQLMPEAPRGHRRQQLCRLHRQKRKLLEDPLFRAFYRHARPYVAPGRIQLLTARDGFRTRTVRLDDRTVVIRRASPSGAEKSPVMYRLQPYRGPAEFVYYHLAGSDYLFLPANEIPQSGASFMDVPESKYQSFKNTFAAAQPS
jgi:hypothetical protein